MKLNKNTIGEIITLIGAILLLGDFFNLFPFLRSIIDPLIWFCFNMLILFLGISLTIKSKKRFLIYWIAVFVTIILMIYIFEPSSLPAFCIKNDFPKTYEKNNVIIYSFLSTMVGRYDIVIYGNGSAYYLNGIQNSDNTGTRAGILPEEKINELISIFRDEGFFCLNDNYEPFISGTDMGTQRISITINGVTKTVEEYGASAPIQFRDIVKELENSVRDLPSVPSSQVCDVIVNELVKVPYVTVDRERFCSFYG